MGSYHRWTSPPSGTPNDDVLVPCEAAVAALDLVYQKAADLLAKADATALATMPAFGFVVSKPTPTTAFVRREGELPGFVGLTADVAYYAHTVAGAISTVAPAVVGNVVQSVGRALNTTTLTVSIADDDYTVL